MDLLRNGTDLETTQAHVRRRFAAITAQSDLQELGDGYVAGLNLRRRFVVPRPPPPLPVPAARSSPPGGDSSSSNSPPVATIVGVTVAVVLGAALATVVAHVLLARRGAGRRRGLFGSKPQAPGPGPNTTLVVTDVQGSTSLWCVSPAGPWACSGERRAMTEPLLLCALRAGKRCLPR